MITIVFGIPGAGKTCLLTYIANCYAYNRERFKNMEKDIIKLNNGGFNLSVPDHPVFSNYPIHFKKFRRSRKFSYYFNPFLLGFKNDKVDVQPTIPYGVYFVDEGQEYYDSRMSSNFPKWISRFFEKHRHNDLEFYIGCQRGDLIDLNVRSHARFLEVIKRKEKYDSKGRIVKIVWTCNFIENVKMYDLYMESKGRDKSTFKQVTITADYNVFELYDSKAEKPKFLSLLLEGGDFDLLEFKNIDFNVDTYKEFMDKYSNACPPNFYKKDK